MPAKKLSPQQRRDKRAKVMLGVLSAVLVIVMVVELPSLMGGKKTPRAASATAASRGTTTGAAGTTPAVVSSPATASAIVVATPQPGQLRAFSRFGAKDPFHPLVSAASGVRGTRPAVPTSPKTGTPPATPPAKPVGTPKTVTFAPIATKPPAQPTGPMVLGAVITLNGKGQVVPVGGQFPTANPVFKLVAVGRKAMWISLVGGSFGNGNRALKVDAGHPVKLVNTTASLDFVLGLLKVKLVPKPAAPAAPRTTTGTTTSSSTTSSTTTTNSLG